MRAKNSLKYIDFFIPCALLGLVIFIGIQVFQDWQRKSSNLNSANGKGAFVDFEYSPRWRKDIFQIPDTFWRVHQGIPSLEKGQLYALLQHTEDGQRCVFGFLNFLRLENDALLFKGKKPSGESKLAHFAKLHNQLIQYEISFISELKVNKIYHCKEWIHVENKN